MLQYYYVIKVGELFLKDIGVGFSTHLVNRENEAKKYYYNEGNALSVRHDVIKEVKRLEEEGLTATIFKREIVVSYNTVEMVIGKDGDNFDTLVPKGETGGEEIVEEPKEEDNGANIGEDDVSGNNEAGNEEEKIEEPIEEVEEETDPTVP